MADITIGGREVTFDLEKISRKEFRSMITMEGSPKADDEIIARVAGVELKFIEDLPILDYKRLIKAFFKKTQEPLADPN